MEEDVANAFWQSLHIAIAYRQNWVWPWNRYMYNACWSNCSLHVTQFPSPYFLTCWRIPSRDNNLLIVCKMMDLHSQNIFPILVIELTGPPRLKLWNIIYLSVLKSYLLESVTWWMQDRNWLTVKCTGIRWCSRTWVKGVVKKNASKL